MTTPASNRAAVPPSPAERQRILHEHFDTLDILVNDHTFGRIRSLGVRTGWHCW
jgi:hypothetical protein